MYRYAQINESGMAVSVSLLAAEIEAENMIPLVEEDDVQPGDVYDGETWTRPDPLPPVEPEPTPEQIKIAELEEQLAIANENTLMTMSALAEVFEMNLTMQDQILALQEQIAGGEPTP